MVGNTADERIRLRPLIIASEALDVVLSGFTRYGLSTPMVKTPGYKTQPLPGFVCHRIRGIDIYSGPTPDAW